MRKKRFRNSKRTLIVLCVSVVLVLALTAYLIGNRFSDFGNSNLKLSDAIAIVGVNYTAVKVNNVSSFSGQLYSNGYKASSISEFVFNTTDHSVTYPVIVTSVLYSLSGTAVANQTEQSVLYTANELPSSASGRFYTNSSAFNYTYSDKVVLMHNVFSIAVINASNAVLPYTADYPVYQYSVVFRYKDFVAFVTLNGYSQLSSYYSVALAEALFRNMVNSGL